jgi:hypothetical protein
MVNWIKLGVECMKKGQKLLLGLTLAAITSMPVLAKVAAEGDAKAMIAKGFTHYKAVGAEQAKKDFSVPGGEYVKGDLYLYCVSNSTKKINAHPVNKGLMGVNFYNLKDVDGVPFGQQMMDKAKGSKVGWVDYKWLNPATKKIGVKRAYFQNFGEDVCAVGVYK